MTYPNQVNDRAGTARIRMGRNGNFIITVIAPAQELFAKISRLPRRQEFLTVRGERWSQTLVERPPVFGAPTLMEVTETSGDGGAIRVTQRMSQGGKEIRQTETWISPDGDVDWRSVDGKGNLRGNGRGSLAHGDGLVGDGSSFSYTVENGSLVAIIQGSGGSSRGANKQSSGTRETQKWEDVTPGGQVVGKGEVTQDTSSGAWWYKSETTGSDGSKLVVEVTGDPNGGGTRQSSLYDAKGNLMKEETMTEVWGQDGSKSSSTLIIDHQTGEETIITITEGPDGSTHKHTSKTDASGNITDEDEDTPPPGGDESSESDEEDADNDSDNDDDDAGSEEGNEGDDDEGGEGDEGGDEGGDEESSSDGTEGDGVGNGRGPTLGSMGGPATPGGSIEKLLAGLDDPEVGESGEQDTGRGLTARQVQRIIEAAHHGGSVGGTGSDGDQNDGLGNGAREIIIPVPHGEISNWEDHPKPNTIGKFARWALALSADLGSAARDVQRVGSQLNRRR